MNAVRPTARAELVEFYATRIVALVLVAGIVPAAALGARPPEPSIVDTRLPWHQCHSLLAGRAKKNRAGGSPCLPGSSLSQQSSSTLAHGSGERQGARPGARGQGPEARNGRGAYRPVRAVPQCRVPRPGCRTIAPTHGGGSARGRASWRGWPPSPARRPPSSSDGAPRRSARRGCRGR